ncbi:MAG: hypothetical protein E5Y31_26210 [Mesorhizobium sp.]|nr:MAG: hypothetical protein E5Y31_26210 [Mesorhizobium sp.]
MASYSTFSDIDLDRQVAALAKELASLKRIVARQSGAYYQDGRDAALDTYSDLAGRLRDAMPAIRKQGRVIEKSARDHPAATAAVGLVVLGLVASLLFSRR